MIFSSCRKHLEKVNTNNGHEFILRLLFWLGDAEYHCEGMGRFDAAKSKKGKKGYSYLSYKP